MNAISLGDKQARVLAALVALTLVIVAIIYFRDEAQRSRRFAAADADNKRNDAEGRVHAHLIAARQELAAGMTRMQQHLTQTIQGMSGMEQSINGRLDGLEYNTRHQLAGATAEIKRPVVGFRPSYMSETEDIG